MNQVIAVVVLIALAVACEARAFRRRARYQPAPVIERALPIPSPSFSPSARIIDQVSFGPFSIQQVHSIAHQLKALSMIYL